MPPARTSAAAPRRHWHEMTTPDFADGDDGGLDRRAAGRGDRAARAASAGLHRHLHRRRAWSRRVDRAAAGRPAGDLPAGAGGRQVERAHLLARHAHLDLGDDDPRLARHRRQRRPRRRRASSSSSTRTAATCRWSTSSRASCASATTCWCVATAWSRFGQPEGVFRRRGVALRHPRRRRRDLDDAASSARPRAHGPGRGLPLDPARTSSRSSSICAPTARSSSAGRRRTSTRTAPSATPPRRPPRRGRAVVDHQARASSSSAATSHAFDIGRLWTP